MDDEREPPEIDAWIRSAITPDSAAGARVAARALALSSPSTPASRRGPLALLTAAALVLVGLVIGLEWRRSPPTPASPIVPIPGGGPLVVIESPEGRRWIVGRVPERAGSSSYVMVIPESKEVR